MNFQHIINQHFEKILIGFMLLIFVQECNNSSKLNGLEKKLKITNARLDSVCTREELVRKLEVEGLKAEKRMIQSTDRRMLDVNRQAEIDAIIKNLEQ